MDPKQTTQPADNTQGNQPVQQPQVPQHPPVQPVAPIGGAKETPVVTNEWVSPSTPEIVLPQEVKEVGVEAQPSVQQVPQAVKDLGVTMAKENTPISGVKEEPLGVKTPRSILDHLKSVHKNVKDSFSWLVRLIIKEQDKKAHSTSSGFEN